MKCEYCGKKLEPKEMNETWIVYWNQIRTNSKDYRKRLQIRKIPAHIKCRKKKVEEKGGQKDSPLWQAGAGSRTYGMNILE